MEQCDFLAIGDTTIDVFIRLKDAAVHCDINKDNCTICMRWGDKIPFESATVVPGVGNAANAAVSASRLGLKTTFVSNVGIDRNGDDILTTFQKEHIDTTYISRHSGVDTNYHYVLWYESERTILVKHNAYPYLFPENLPVPKTMYFSSVKGEIENYHAAIADYLDLHPEIFFAFQPGIFEIKIGVNKLERFYRRSNFFICNKQEAQHVLELPEAADDAEMLTRKLHDLGPKIVVITDGPKGSYGREENGMFFSIPIFPDPSPPVERTGAGDAFSSTTAAFMTLGMSLKEAMIRGSVNAAYVVQEIGSQKGLLSRKKIEEYIASAPQEYRSSIGL